MSRITTLHAAADRLMSLATHESVVHELQLALLDLSHARLWLEEWYLDEREAILEIAERATDLAEWRLGMVQIALATDGLGASVID